MHLENGNYKLAAVNVQSFLEESEFASGVTANANHVVHGVVDPTSETFLTVGADGFKLSGVQDAIGTVISGLDASVSAETTSKHVSIKIDEVDGKLTAVTLTDSDIASADDLATLSGKTFTVATSSNASITTAVTTATDGTKSVDLITDADKIQMSGFTSNNGALSGIVESDSISTALEKVDTVITQNEEVTAAALNDLNTKVDTLSGKIH